MIADQKSFLSYVESTPGVCLPVKLLYPRSKSTITPSISQYTLYCCSASANIAILDLAEFNVSVCGIDLINEIISWFNCSASAFPFACSSGVLGLLLKLAVSKYNFLTSAGSNVLLASSGSLLINIKRSPNSWRYNSIFLFVSLQVRNTIWGNNERSRSALRFKDVIGETYNINIIVSYPNASNSSFFLNNGFEAAPVPSIITLFSDSSALAYFSLVTPWARPINLAAWDNSSGPKSFKLVPKPDDLSNSSYVSSTFITSYFSTGSNCFKV